MFGPNRKIAVLLVLLYTTAALSAPSPINLTTESLVITSSESPKEPTDEKETSSDETATEPSAPGIPKIYQMDVTTNVTNRFATTQVLSKVKNLGQKAQEATFSIVLPETAYISKFVMEIDGKSYEAYVKEKEEAKQIYNEAVQSGISAGHVEASARNSNRFTVSVNVEPQSKATFKLWYEELLQRQNEQYEVVLNIHPGQPVKNLDVKVNINETRPLKFVKSPSLRSGNEISKNNENLDPLADIQVKDNQATVTFNPDLDRQKVLAKGLGGKEENGLSGQFVVQYDVEHDPQGGEVLVKDGYFVHFFSPTGLPPLPKHVIFVLDTSGSMDGNRIQQLKQAMNSILAELKEDDILNIVEFSSTVRVWNIPSVEVQYEEGSDPWAVYPGGDQPAKNKTEQVLPPASPATKANLDSAKKVVEKLNAYGGTDIKSALEVGLKLIKKNMEIEADKNNTHQPMIIFLTDGEPTVGEVNTNSIISKVTESNSGQIRSPIFSLSFGDGADREFLQKISLKNLGFARHIYEAADASLQLEMFYKQISSPLLSNITFKYVSNVTKLTRVHFPIFFHGSELVVAGRTDDIDPGFAEPTRIIGCGIGGRPIELIPKIEHPVGALERLWAYLTVKQILEERDAAENKTEFTNKALNIALKYSFVTPVSSLVVVKPNDTRPVDTEDASKASRDHPYYLNSMRSRIKATSAYMPLGKPLQFHGRSGYRILPKYSRPSFASYSSQSARRSFSPSWSSSALSAPRQMYAPSASHNIGFRPDVSASYSPIQQKFAAGGIQPLSLPQNLYGGGFSQPIPLADPVADYDSAVDIRLSSVPMPISFSSSGFADARPVKYSTGGHGHKRISSAVIGSLSGLSFGTMAFTPARPVSFASLPGLPGPPQLGSAGSGPQFSPMATHVPLSGAHYNSVILTTPLYRPPVSTQVDSDYEIAVERVEELTTITSTSTTTSTEPCTSTPTPVNVDPYDELKVKLPWLADILNQNGTLSLSSENYKLGSTPPSATAPECPKTPTNGTAAGECVPLQNCSEVFDELKDVETFTTYICPLDASNKELIGICCPKATPKM